eukprot:s1434_g4.t1
MPTRGAQSAARFDLGFSDEEDNRGQPESSKAETVHDLVNQRRDPAMVLGSSSTRLRPSSSFQLGGGIDPLESLLKKDKKEQPDDDDDNADEFDREFRKLAGQSLGEQVFAATAPAEVLRDQASSVSRRSRDEAEDLPLPPDSRGPDPDLEDIVGEILGESVSDTKPVPRGSGKSEGRVPEGAFEVELAHPQPSRASEKSGSASRLVPPSGPKAVHQAHVMFRKQDSLDNQRELASQRRKVCRLKRGGICSRFETEHFQ